MEESKEVVRLPSIINMEIEADKLEGKQDEFNEKTLHLNIPLQISVDTAGLASRRIPSPAAGKLWSRGESIDSRGRVSGGTRGPLPTTNRVRSVSAGRDKKQEMAARYWGVLFENLRRAVDDLYRTCEMDESCVAAKEVVMVLENYVKDFKNMIKWLKLKTEYENTPEPQRPTSLAWDIRKSSSVGKHTPTGCSGKLTPTRQLLISSPAKRQLTFDDIESGTRSRKVSETIKEAKNEWDGSPHEPCLESRLIEDRTLAGTASSLPHDLEVKDIEEDANENVSEHEKSDSEQEKDSTVSCAKPEKDESCLDASLGDQGPSVQDEEKSETEGEESCITEAEDVKPKAAEEQKEDAANEKDITTKSVADDGPVLEEAQKSPTGQSKTSMDETVAVDAGKTGNNVRDKSTEKSREKPNEKTRERSSDKSRGIPPNSNAACSGTPVKPSSTNSNTASSQQPAAARRTFASTVKSTTTLGAGGRNSVGTGTTGARAGTAAAASRPRITRALTTILPSNRANNIKPGTGLTATGASNRRNAAGLLMTVSGSVVGRSASSTAASCSKSGHRRTSAGLAANGGNQGTGGAGKPSTPGGQQRISLVARQAQFASGGANKSRPSSARERTKPSNSRPTSGRTATGSTVGKGRSWAERVSGKTEDYLALQEEEEDDEEEGWCKVRRPRSRFSPGVTGSNRSLANRLHGVSGHYRAANRFNVPTGAVSLPSLSLEEPQPGLKMREKEGAVTPPPNERIPGLEKSASSASIVRNRDTRSTLESLSERGLGSSAESITGSDPSSLKKKKDQINKQRALKKTGSDSPGKSPSVGKIGGTCLPPGCPGSKAKVKKTKSAPDVQMLRQKKKGSLSGAGSREEAAHEADVDEEDEGSASSRSQHQKQRGSASPNSGSAGHDTNTDSSMSRSLLLDNHDTRLESVGNNATSETDDTDNDEILERQEAAIAKVELEAADLQREIEKTELLADEMTDDTDDLEMTDDTDFDGVETDDGGGGGAARAARAAGDDDDDGEKAESGADERATTPHLTSSSGLEAVFEGLSWAEQIELEEQLADSQESRYPGRAIHLHEKLSSPARRKEPHETFKHYQEKQDKARIRRLHFSQKKAKKLAILNKRIGEVLEHRDRLVEERKAMIEKKLKKAEEKRIQYIQTIKKKAHEEEEKLKEIAFINELQAQNARMDIITQVSTADEKCEERLAEIAGERAKKAEQREEREARAEERRRAIQEAQQRKIDAIIERWREREERIQGSKAAAREQRKVSARQKDRERLEKLSTVRAAEKDMKEELQGKIQQKQEDAAKRHAENLENIRQKAFEFSVQKCGTNEEGVPVIKPYKTKKKCEACNVLIKSEVHLLSHLRGKQHTEEITRKNEGKDMSGAEITTYNLKHIVDAPEGETDPKSVLARERGKAGKKRAKKLKAKMAAKAEEYTVNLATPNKHQDSPNRAKIGKSIRDIEKLLASQGKGAWPNNSVSSLERAFGEICRAFDRNNAKDKDVFYALGGFDVLAKIYKMVEEGEGGNTCAIPIKSLVSAAKVFTKATSAHKFNREFLLLSNRLTLLADILSMQLKRLIPDMGTRIEMDQSIGGPDTDPLTQALMQFLSNLLQQMSVGDINQMVVSRLQDFVSYLVSIEIVDHISGYFQLVRDPIDSSPEVAEFLLAALQFLTALSSAVEIKGGDRSGEDPTQLVASLQWTELAGTVSMLYGMLLHQGRDTAREAPPPLLPAHTLAVATETFELLHRLARQKLSMVQTVLGLEGISLEFRHIASYLLWYCQHHNQTALLNQVIILVGYFTANHPENQSIVQSGTQPSVLQQLANLPFQYFSQPELKVVLFPTLLSCCHNNTTNANILTQEMSWQLIEEFIRSKEGKDSLLVKLVIEAA